MAVLRSQKDAEALFWGAMRLVLILGFVCLTLSGLLIWRPAADSSVGQALSGPIQHLVGGWSDPVLRVLGVGIWAGAVAFCALVLQYISGADNLLKVAVTMWRPLALLGIAGYLLFFNDQGRELGVSLLGETFGWQLFFLFLALLYWAGNTWHTSRLGIRAALERGELGVAPSWQSQATNIGPQRRFIKGDETWLFWPPRLLGVCAHLFAAINLSLSAWGLPPSAWGGHDMLRWLDWTAPVAILLATAWIWAETLSVQTGLTPTRR
jgi:hypothetical protein